MENRSHSKLFGVALDASDDPVSLQLKWGAMTARERGDNHFHADPYDTLMEALPDGGRFEGAGKFSVPSWLGPRPLPDCRPSVHPENFQRFYDEQGFLKIARELRDFVTVKIFPDIPVMIGIDHSATGGVISALAGRYGSQDISVMVLDQHFDALPVSLRMEAGLLGRRDMAPDMVPMPSGTPGADEYCCGNFWAYLMDEGVLLPQNLSFIGIADYPRDDMGENWKKFRDAYLHYEERGCGFFPIWQFEGDYMDALARFIRENVKTPYVYVSLDLDVGAMNCIHAARYMDTPGISRETLLDIAGFVGQEVRKGVFSLVGYDIMEFNMHFLGLDAGNGIKDHTIDVVKEYMMVLDPAALPDQ